MGAVNRTADQERAVVAACELAATSASQRAELELQSTWGVPGIPEVASLPGGNRKLVLSSYWAPLKTWLNLFLFLPRSTIPYLQLLGQMCFRTEKYVNLERLMWCIPVSYLAPEWGLAPAPHYPTLGALCCEAYRVHTGNIQVTASGQILPPDEHAPAVRKPPTLALWVWNRI